MDKKKIAKEILSQSYNVTDQAGEELQVVDVKDVFDIVSRIVDSAFLPLVSNCRCNEPVKCRNCDEMVVMVSTGDICPSCYC